jgi:hypothetical protein
MESLLGMYSTHHHLRRAQMAGKGSRQRTYGATFNDNYDRIFGKAKGSSTSSPMGTEWIDPEGNQYPPEAREGAQKGAEKPSKADQ